VSAAISVGRIGDEPRANVPTHDVQGGAVDQEQDDERTMSAQRTAYIGLGSNLGQRARNLRQAIERLDDRGTQVGRVSTVYETEPVGPIREQPMFYNAVAELHTELESLDLLRHCQAVEAAMGRRRSVPKGPRVIDLDLLLVDEVELSHPDLELPHPNLTERAFVLLPLIELRPMATDPRDGQLLCRQLDPLLRKQHIRRVGSIGLLAAREDAQLEATPPPDAASAGSRR
jgi:2-amino-4-hydroxy-6-hydroxymethyldihydropteridine diphosphokinase